MYWVNTLSYCDSPLQGLLSANSERKSEIDALRGDHDTLKKDHDSLVNTTERENDLR